MRTAWRNACDKSQIYVKFDGIYLGFETPPIIENGSTLVPMRFLFEQMGADVEWNGETQTATATLDNTEITFSIIGGVSNPKYIPSNLTYICDLSQAFLHAVRKSSKSNSNKRY